MYRSTLAVHSVDLGGIYVLEVDIQFPLHLFILSILCSILMMVMVKVPSLRSHFLY